MDRLPAAFARVLDGFAPVFSRRIWTRAQILVIGALLSPGARTVAAALRVMGIAHQRSFPSYHRVLSRARWSSRALARILFLRLVRVFVPSDAPVVVGIDETLERRRGAKIAAKGLYRDNARSSKTLHVKSHGLRWISLMLLTPVPWAKRVWALPFLTLLVPSERYCTARGLRYKRLCHWGQQAIVQLRRWLRERQLVVVADNNYSAIELLHRARRVHAIVVTRLRLDAALYGPAPTREQFRARYPRGQVPKHGPRQPTPQARLEEPTTEWQRLCAPWYGATQREIEITTDTAVWFHNGLPPVPVRWVLIRDPAGKFDPQALVCNAPEVSAEEMIQWFLLRWQVEVTFAETRAHLGMETQRQWSQPAIERTTPVLFGLFSLVALWAKERLGDAAPPVRRAAWYEKQAATFSDLLALLRQQLWLLTIKRTCPSEADVVVIPRPLLDRLTEALAFAP